jgi:hypothetical protein
MSIKQNGGVFGRNPTLNDVTVEGDLTVDGAVVHTGDLTVDNINLSGNTISSTNTNGDLVLDPNGTGNVGVNEGSPVREFHVKTTGVIPMRLESTGGDNQIEFVTSGGTPRIGAYSDNFLIFTGGGLERVRVDSSGHLIVPAGVTLGTATGVHTTANTLDDYEEGAASLTVTGGAGTITTASASAVYTKIGRSVILNGSITITDNGTGSSFLNVAGLPFVPANAAAGVGREGVNNGKTCSLYLSGSSTTMQVYAYDNTYPVSTGSIINFTVVYSV